MQHIINTKNSICGDVVAGYRDKDGDFYPIVFNSNMLVYGSADIMAKLLAGDGRYAINYMYFKYKNLGISQQPDPDPISRSNTVDEFLSLDGSNSIDWLRVPIISAPKFDISPEDSVSYSGNRLTFVGTTASVPQVGNSPLQLPFGEDSEQEGGPSKVYSIALVCAPEPSNKNKDIVFARTNLDAAISAISDSYIDIFWTITLS